MKKYILILIFLPLLSGCVTSPVMGYLMAGKMAIDGISILTSGKTVEENIAQPTRQVRNNYPAEFEITSDHQLLQTHKVIEVRHMAEDEFPEYEECLYDEIVNNQENNC